MTVPPIGVSLVLPVKATDRAKTRLDLPHEARQRLAVALARQSLEIVTRCVPPDQVYVVTSDPHLGRRVQARGAHLVDEGSARGLNRAAELGIAKASGRFPEHTVVVMVADLPELTADALLTFLQAVKDARGVPIYVADKSGTGTTMVAAAPGLPGRMVFGRDSAARFGALGFRAARHAPASLRADLDTLDDLWELTPELRAALCDRPVKSQFGRRSA